MRQQLMIHAALMSTLLNLAAHQGMAALSAPAAAPPAATAAAASGQAVQPRAGYASPALASFTQLLAVSLLDYTLRPPQVPAQGLPVVCWTRSHVVRCLTCPHDECLQRNVRVHQLGLCIVLTVV